MATIFNRWAFLAAGVVAIQGLLLAINHVPGIRKPEIAENRALAVAPGVPRGIAGLKDYREGMDAYMADNFTARTYLVAWVNYLRYRLGYSGTSRVVVGRDGWLFYDDGSHLSQLRHGNVLAAGDVNAWVSTFAARTEALTERGIDYLVVSPPVKERIYPDKAPAWATQLAGLADADALAAATRQAGYDNFVALKDALSRQRTVQSDVYSPFDIHWTGNGAYIGYVQILSALKRLGHAIEPLPLQAFTRIEKPALSQPRDVAMMLGISSFVHQDYVQYHDPRQEAALRVQYLTARHDWTGDRVVDTGQEGKPVIQLVVDSFSNELLPFLYPHFSRLIISHNQEGFHREDLTTRYSPDIVVVEVLESGVRHSMSPAMQPGPELLAALNLKLAQPIRADVQAGARSRNESAVATAIAEFSTAARIPVEAPPGQQVGLTHRCNLELLEFAGDAQSSGTLQAVGWFADVDGARVADEVSVLLQSGVGSYSANTAVRNNRSDVARFFKKPVLSKSGFALSARVSGLPLGSYDVYLLQRYGADSLICLTTRSLAVDANGVRVVAK